MLSLLQANSDQKHALDVSAIVTEADRNGKITYVNDKLLEISGYRREELLGLDHKVLNSGYHAKTFFRSMWKTILSGRPHPSLPRSVQLPPFFAFTRGREQ